MKLRFFLVFSVIILLLGMTGCKKEPSVNLKELEQSLVGLWWDEYEYSGTTEAGIPFSKVLLAIKADADHTGCIYLGVFDAAHSEPLEVYGGPVDAAFKWRLLEDGSVRLSDPASGESTVITRAGSGDGGNYGDAMTNVSNTNVTYANGSMTVNNGSYSGTLTKAASGTEIEGTLSTQVSEGDLNLATPMTIEALTAGTVKLVISGTLDTGMKYAVNGGEKTLIYNSTDITVSAGDKVQFYGNGTSTQVYGGSTKVRIQSSGTGFKCKAYGNIMSLLDEENFATKTDLPDRQYVFRYLFITNTALTDASGLLLPATTLAQDCYQSMFYSCKALTAAPELLPATTLAGNCYCLMFCDCKALTTAPALPATTLAQGCYKEMFQGCKALATAPALPATTLAKECYFEMFRGCEALTSAPDLPATTLVDNCYRLMFCDCTSLTTAPELPAETMVSECYEGMFSGCKNLSSVKCLATSGISHSSTYGWLRGVAASGTFYLASGSGSKWSNGMSGIPYGWTGLYPDGTTKVNPRNLSQATAEDLGKIVGANGKIYDSLVSVTNEGTTAVALIASMTKTNNSNTYLALALHDEDGGAMDWNRGWNVIKEKPAVNGGSWRMPSVDHWKAMFRAFGGNDLGYVPLEEAIISAGGSSFIGESHWTDTQYRDIESFAYYIGRMDSETVYFFHDEKGYPYRVRAALFF